MGQDWPPLATQYINNNITITIIHDIFHNAILAQPPSHKYKIKQPIQITQTITQSITPPRYYFSPTQTIAMVIAYARFYHLLKDRGMVINKIYNLNNPTIAAVDLLLSELLKHNPSNTTTPTNTQLRDKLRTLNPHEDTIIDYNIKRIAVFAIETLNIAFKAFTLQLNQLNSSNLQLHPRANTETLPIALQFKRMGITHTTEWLRFIQNQPLIANCLQGCVAVYKQRTLNQPTEQLETLLQATLTQHTNALTRVKLTQLATINYGIPGHNSLPTSFTSLPVPFHILKPQHQLQSYPETHNFKNFNDRCPIFRNGFTGGLHPNILELLQM
jgi:hypothetical protein